MRLYVVCPVTTRGEFEARREANKFIGYLHGEGRGPAEWLEFVKFSQDGHLALAGLEVDERLLVRLEADSDAIDARFKLPQRRIEVVLRDLGSVVAVAWGTREEAMTLVAAYLVFYAGVWYGGA